MVTIKTSAEGVTCNAEIRGVAIYLDMFAINELAKHNPARRQKLLSALHTGNATILFSPTNAGEIGKLAGRSLEKARELLADFGPHWFPIELNALEVVERETAGQGRLRSCGCELLLADYLKLAARMSTTSNILDVSFESLTLGTFVDRLAPQRESIKKGMTELDRALVDRIAAHSRKWKADPAWLDNMYPRCSFDRSKPATFASKSLFRLLVSESREYSLGKGDGIDFCHAVMGSSFADFATLDWNWKRRIGSLPKPNGLARIYYREEIDQMIEDISLFISRTDEQRAD